MSDPHLTKSVALGAKNAYTFDETSGVLIDHVAANNGTVIGSPTRGADDQRGLPSAYTFNGSTQYITLASNLFNGLSAYTAEIVYSPSASGSGLTLLGSRDGAGDGIWINVNSGLLRISHNSTLSVSTLASTVGEWHHGHLTWDGANVRVYQGGVLQDTDADATAISVTATPYIASRSLSAPSLLFPGSISFLAIYPTALNGTQIGELVDAASEIAASGSAVQLSYGKLSGIIGQPLRGRL